MNFIDKNNKIYIAGSDGMVGNAIYKLLIKKGYKENILTTSRKDVDLRDDKKVEDWFKNNKPKFVIIAAAKVGGILANKNFPVEFLLNNLKIQNNLIENSYKFGVKKLLFLGSSCIYPKLSKQPIKENYLLSEFLESSNEYYAIAKIAGLKLCEAYRKQYKFDAITLMPTNLYGPKDNYNLNEGHVMAALIRKIYQAKRDNIKQINCWGSGTPLREFLHVDDLAEACLFVLRNWYPNENNSPLDKEGNPLSWLNVGSEDEISIKNLAHKISNILEYDGDIFWDKKFPDGTPRKKLDLTFINKLGWSARIDLDKGIKNTIKSFESEKIL